jgi:hypothetical protein
VCEPFDDWKNIAGLPVIQSQAASRRLRVARKAPKVR